MDTLIGVILLLSFLAVVYYVVRGGSPIVAFIGISAFWAALSGADLNTILNQVFQEPVTGNAGTILIIIFGSWFGQVLVKTDIAGSLVKRSVELGGDRPLIVTIIIMLVTSFLFLSMYGVGCAIAVGVIALPIMLSMGVPAAVAAPAFTMSIAAAMFINVIDINMLAALFPEGVFSYDASYLNYGFIGMGVWLAFGILMVIFNLKRYGLRRAWAVNSQTEAKRVPAISFLSPIVPIVMIMGFKWPVVPSLLVGIIFALVTTIKSGTYEKWTELLHRSFYDGVSEIGSIIGVWVSVMMFIAAGTMVAPKMNALIGNVLPSGPLTLVLAFAILGVPLTIYRGPLAGVGAGAALLSLMFDKQPAPLFLIFLMFINTQIVQNCLDPTNSWTLWTTNFTKVTPKKLFSSAMAFVWIACAVCCFVAYFYVI